jgi:hypothetical protein
MRLNGFLEGAVWSGLRAARAITKPLEEER